MSMVTRRTFLGAAGSALALAAMNRPAFAQDTALRHFWWGNPERDKRTFAVIDIYNSKMPGVKVSGETLGFADYFTKLTTQIADAIRRVDSGEGVIILTDLFGGTPSNLAISLMQAGRVEVNAGINLPMLIRLAKARGCMNVRDATAAARDAGRNYITIASEFLGQDA